MSVTQSCLTLCDPMDCSPLGSSPMEFSKARILEWVAIPFYRGSSWPRDQTWVSSIASRSFTFERPGKPPSDWSKKWVLALAINTGLASAEVFCSLKTFLFLSMKTFYLHPFFCLMNSLINSGVRDQIKLSVLLLLQCYDVERWILHEHKLLFLISP